MNSKYSNLGKDKSFGFQNSFGWRLPSDKSFKLFEIEYSINEVLNSLGPYEDCKVLDIIKKYSDSFDIELDTYQTNKISNLIESLKGLSSKDLENLEPSIYFSESWSETNDSPLYSFKDKVQDLFDLFNWMVKEIDSFKDEDTKIKVSIRVFKYNSIIIDAINKLEDTLSIISQVLENYTKVVFGAKLSKLAKAKGITQNDLANKLQVRQQTVSDWYCGNSLPSIQKAIQLALELDTSLDYLVRAEVQDSNLSSDFLFKSVGLDSTSSEILKKLDKNSKEIKTLNLLIHNHGIDNQISLLSAISDFLEITDSENILIVSDEDLSELFNLLKGEDLSTQDIYNTIGDFKNRLIDKNKENPFSFTDTDNAKLLHIMKILNIIKYELKKDAYGW